MMYNRRSVTAHRFWVRYALLRGRPWRSISDVIGAHVESAGTKAYTVSELVRLFSAFHTITARPVIRVAHASPASRPAAQKRPRVP